MGAFLTSAAPQLKRSLTGRVAELPPEPSLKAFESFDTYVFDCDGVIWGIEEKDSKIAVETINYLIAKGKRVMFVTNNSNKRRKDFVRDLEFKHGINFGAFDEDAKLGMMISASYTTAVYLKKNRLLHPFVITSDKGLLEELRFAGICEYYATISEEGAVKDEFLSPTLVGAEISEIINAHPNVDCIVVGWDMGLTAKKVGTAINFIKWHEDLNKPDNRETFKPMQIIACAGDAGGVLGTTEFKPGAGKSSQHVKIRAIGNGAMADMIARSFDPPQPWLDMGKPSNALIGLLREAYGIDLSKSLMIGDTVQTDIVFGNRAGMKTLLVLSGVTTKQELDTVLEGSDTLRHPTYVLPKLGHYVESGKLDPSAPLPPLRNSQRSNGLS